MRGIRRVYNSDSFSVISLIDSVYREYGYAVNTKKYDKDLLDFERYYFTKGGFFWVYLFDKEIIGTVAVLPSTDKVCELKRLYLHKIFRGSGIGEILFKTVESWGEQRGYDKLVLWSDTTFLRAHFFYKKMGMKQGIEREMYDADVPYKEFYFEKNISNDRRAF